MAKKRKASSGPRRSESPPEPKNEASARLAFSNWKEIADSEDEFLLNRDEILLDEGLEAKRRRKHAEEEALLEEDGVEVLDLPDSEDFTDEDVAEADFSGLHDDDEEAQDQSYEAKDEFGEYGTTKRDFYGQDHIEDEEEAMEEEREAIRQSEKHMAAWAARLQEMEDIQGLDLDDEKPDDAAAAKISIERKIPKDAGTEEKRAHLHETYPMFEPLSKELLNLHPTYTNLLAKFDEASPVGRAQCQTLGAYLGMISMYLALLTSTALTDPELPAMPSNELAQHPVTERVAEWRQTWLKVREWRELAVKRADEPAVRNTPDAALLDFTQPKPKTMSSKRQRKAAITISTGEKASLARRQARLAAIEADLADLEESVLPVKPIEVSKVPVHSISAFGDQQTTTETELIEKARRKRNLGFYTSQFVQKLNRRSAAGRELGGDTDIPYRETRFTKFQADAQAKRERADKTKPVEDDDEDYQDLASKKAAKAEIKAQKRSVWETKESERLSQHDHALGEEGKRSLNFQIEKNKGLAPFRKKENRTPRVRKRRKFEEKRKKLGSVRAVYKGGEGRGGYGGELSGISSDVVKSRRL